jgi:O-antigen/teichoic acid export membrane protein
LGSLLVTQKILLNLGSDYNGVNATATQIVTILALIEGGFTLASQVSLYKPVSSGDLTLINKIISYTSKKMRIVGLLMLIIGIGLSSIYALFVKTELSYPIVLGIMLIAVLNSSISFGVISKYRIMFQVTQTEYICGYINIGVNIALYLAVFVALDYTDNVIAIRLIYLAAELLRGALIAIMAKRYFKFLDFKSNTDEIRISGTREVFVSKITSLIYNSAPILMITAFVGATSASVYSVYLSITSIILTLLTHVVNAPMHGLGQLISKSENEDTRGHLVSVFREYELTIALINSIICSIMFVAITPFIAIYTSDVVDISYNDTFYSIVMVLIVMVQVLHLPSGNCMNVAGKFKAVRNIQLAATISLVVMMSLGVLFYDLKGLLIGKLATAIILSVCEIYYTYKTVIKCKLTSFISMALATYLPAILISAVEAYIVNIYFTVDSWFEWIILGFTVTCINALILVGLNAIANRKMTKKIFSRAKRLLNRH